MVPYRLLTVSLSVSNDLSGLLLWQEGGSNQLFPAPKPAKNQSTSSTQFFAMCMIADKQVCRQWEKLENASELVGREARRQGVLQQNFSQAGREGRRTAVFSL